MFIACIIIQEGSFQSSIYCMALLIGLRGAHELSLHLRNFVMFMGFCYILVRASSLLLGFFQFFQEKFPMQPGFQVDCPFVCCGIIIRKVVACPCPSALPSELQTLERLLGVLHVPLWSQRRVRKQIPLHCCLFVPAFHIFSKLQVSYFYLSGLESECIAESEKGSGRGKSHCDWLRYLSITVLLCSFSVTVLYIKETTDFAGR